MYPREWRPVWTHWEQLPADGDGERRVEVWWSHAYCTGWYCQVHFREEVNCLRTRINELVSILSPAFRRNTLYNPVLLSHSLSGHHNLLTSPPSPPPPSHEPSHPSHFTTPQLSSLHHHLLAAAPSGFILASTLVDTLCASLTEQWV